MKIFLKRGQLVGSVDAIISKSYLHRILIAAALSENKCRIVGINDGKDVLVTLNAIKKLGAQVSANKSGYLITPSKKYADSAIIDLNECGSALRFLLPVTAALNIKCSFVGAKRLSERPISELIESLKNHGARFSSDRLPLTLSGGLSGGEYRISQNVSSQYITGLLMALPLLDDDSKIIVSGKAASASYVDITLAVLKRFSIRVEKTDYGYYVFGKQKYRAPKIITAEGDWSNSAFFLVGGAISGAVTVNNLKIRSKQGDREIYKILKKMGCKISSENSNINVEKSALTAIKIDAENIPDLVPIICVLAMNAHGVTEIFNVSRLVEKESDRLSGVINMVNGFGGKARYENGTLYVSGGITRFADIDGQNDHRMVMSAAICALNSVSGAAISSYEAVEKSYPDFFGDYTKLGGGVEKYE